MKGNSWTRSDGDGSNWGFFFLNEYRRQDPVGAAFTHGKDSGVLRVQLVCRYSALRLLLFKSFVRHFEVESDKWGSSYFLKVPNNRRAAGLTVRLRSE